MILRWLPEDITVHNEDLEGISHLLHIIAVACHLLHYIIICMLVIRNNIYNLHSIFVCVILNCTCGLSDCFRSECNRRTRNM